MRNHVEISIKVELKPSHAQPSGPKARARRIGEGHFQIVLDADKSLDIDALEDSLLQANYPALRDALATHLQQEVKKSGRDASTASTKRDYSVGA